jgi:hypothetical protein
MKSPKSWLALTLLLAPATVNPASLEGPRLGMVFDRTARALRPISGIPGAAILGEPLDLGLDLRRTAVSPQQDYVLATEGEHNQVIVLTAGHVPVFVAGADRGPDELVLSPGGQAAALYFKDRNRIEIVSGLPAAPRVATALFLSAGSTLSALAIGDDQTVLAGVGGAVYWVSHSGEVPVLTNLQKISAIVLTSTQFAIVADAATNQIHRVRNITGAIETDILAGPVEGISSPVAVAVSRDNRRVFVANGKSETVALLDLRGKIGVTRISCACTPTGLDRLAGDNVFRLTEPSNRPMWVLEARTGGSRIVFVPADLPRSTKK